MALSRTFLKGLGLTDEQVSAIVEGNEESIAALKEQRDGYKAQADKLKDAEAKIAELESKVGEPDVWREKYEKEHSAFESYKTAQTEKETASAKASAYKQLLIDAGVSAKRIDSILKVTDLSALELKDGKLADAETLTTGIKADWADFIQNTDTSGANTQQPPNNEGGITKEQFNSMGYNERLKLYSENKELYETLKGE